MNALRTLTDAGLTVRTDGDRLIVTPASVLTDSLRSLIREHKLELLTVLRSTPAPHPDGHAVATAGARDRAGANALMTIEQADRCHVGGWNDAEIQAFTDRRDLLLRWGYTEPMADDLAERLTLRDREGDERRLCAECKHGRSHRCPDGAPVSADVLHRCTGFKL